MVTPPRIPPRNVPTLTQVVHPAALVTPQPAPVPGPAAPAGAPALPPEADALVQQALRAALAEVTTRMEYRLKQTLTKVVAEHTARMVPVLQQELEAMVRDCVHQALDAHAVRTRR